MSLAGFLNLTEGVESAARHADAALELAERLDDDTLRVGALEAMAHVRFRAGDPGAVELLDRVGELVPPLRSTPTTRGAPLNGAPAVWSYEFARARTLLAILDDEWSSRDEHHRATVLFWLGLTEHRAGDFRLAAEFTPTGHERSGASTRSTTTRTRPPSPSMQRSQPIGAISSTRARSRRPTSDVSRHSRCSMRT